MIDFFVVHAASLEVLYDVPTRPHWPVVARLKASRAALRRWRIAKPPPYHLKPPLGCAQAPDSEAALRAAASWSQLGDSFLAAVRPTEVEPLVLNWYAGAHEELAALFYDSPGSVGAIGDVSRVVWANETTILKVGARAAGDQWTTLWAVLDLRLGELMETIG